MDCTNRIYHFTHSTDQSRTEGARDSLARGRQGAYGVDVMVVGSSRREYGTRQDRTPEAKRWSPPAPAPGSESLRAVSMYLTQLQPQSSPQVTSEDIILARVRSLSARPSVNIRVYLTFLLTEVAKFVN